MRPGDLVFSRGKGLIPWMIRQITGGHWNHVMLFVGEGLCISSESPRIKYVRLDDYLARGEELGFGRVLSRGDAEAMMVVKIAREMVGKKYDHRGLLGIWFRFAMKRLHDPFVSFEGTNLLENREAFWCSEMIGYVWGKVALRFSSEDISWLTPTQIFECPFVGKIED